MKRKIIFLSLASVFAMPAAAQVAAPGAPLTIAQAMQLYNLPGGGYPAVITNPGGISFPINKVAIAIGENTVAVIRELQAAITGQNAELLKTQLSAGGDTLKQIAKVVANSVAQIPPSACSARIVAAQRQAAANNAMLGSNAGQSRAIAGMRATTGGGGVQSAKLVSEVDAKYCTKATNPNCQNTGAVPTSPGSDLKDAHLNVATLLNGAAIKDPANPDGSEKLTFRDSNLQNAARAYIDTVMRGVDTPRMLSQSEVKTPGGQEYEALRIVYLAKVSSAQYTFENLYASRLPLPNSAKMVAQLEQSVGNAGYLSRFFSNLKSSFGADVSEAELMKLNVSMRTSNPDWYSAIQQMETPALLRELLMVEANRQAMEYHAMRAGELQAIHSAEQTLESVKNNLAPALKKAEMSLGSKP